MTQVSKFLEDYLSAQQNDCAEHFDFYPERGEWGVSYNRTTRYKSSLPPIGKLTLIHPFYNNEQDSEKKRFELQLETWLGWSEEVRNNIKIIVVDDGSPNPIHKLLGKKQKLHLPLNLCIARIAKNLKWNTPGALNLGIFLADTEWALIMDSDCMFKNGMIEQVLAIKPHEEETLYKFDRHRIYKDKEEMKRYLSCTMLAKKDTFLKVGMFDENLSGEHSNGYGFFDNDFDFRQGVLKIKFIVFKKIIATEYMPDLVGRVERNHDADHRVNKHAWYEKKGKNIVGPTPGIRFPIDIMYWKYKGNIYANREDT
jgi:glycosyltransferase involved in cell wall biosynthesis